MREIAKEFFDGYQPSFYFKQSEQPMVEEYDKVKFSINTVPTTSFNNYNGWVIKISKDKIEFNEELKLTADEFAKEFIRLVEEYYEKRN